MKKIITNLLILASINTSIIDAKEVHIVPMAEKDGMSYVLLGLNGNWSYFSGSTQQKGKEVKSGDVVESIVKNKVGLDLAQIKSSELIKTNNSEEVWLVKLTKFIPKESLPKGDDTERVWVSQQQIINSPKNFVIKSEKTNYETALDYNTFLDLKNVFSRIKNVKLNNSLTKLASSFANLTTALSS